MLPREKKKLLAWLSLFPTLAFLGITLWLSRLDPIAWQDSDPTTDWLAYVYHHRHGLLIGLAFIASVGSCIGLIDAAFARKRALINVLDHMHARFWIKKGDADPEYRVSLYLPSYSARKLRCYYRTDHKRTRKTWSTAQPTDGRSADGVAGAVWLTGMTVDVGSPPERATEDELREYRQHTHTTESILDRRSWTMPAVLGVPVQGLQHGLPIGVLLVERNRPSVKVGRVTIRDYEHDLYLCAMILEGRV